jgi:hypothetical protein
MAILANAATPSLNVDTVGVVVDAPVCPLASKSHLVSKASMRDGFDPK